jgi:hypothetical protein
VFGESHVDEIAATHNLPVLAKMPFDSRLPALCDKGIIELMECDALDEAVKKITSL